MVIRNKLIAAAAAAGMGLVSLVGTALPAGAEDVGTFAYTDCTPGRACVWTGYSYPTTPDASFTSNIVLTDSSNAVSSIVNNDGSRTAYFYDRADQTGVNVVLYSTSSGLQWRDPDLSNGTNATSDNWDDRISSAKY